jgi:hypothetical protein
MIKLLVSRVPGHIGSCRPIWLNTSQIDLRTQRCGITGFFRLVKPFLFWYKSYGEEFHGYIENGEVYTTKGMA